VKGLEPLIAAVLLIAITLVIAIAVVSWTTGLFNTIVGGAESLMILPNASLTNTSSGWRLNISIRNTGAYYGETSRL
jgi:flagellin-like protein